MSPPGTFERVYAAIKNQLRMGAFRPGERLEPAALSDQLNSSVTPIRDALHRLTGERLVEAPRHEGFRAPMLTETMLRHLYAWHFDLLMLALAKPTRSDAPDDKVSLELPSYAKLNAVFLVLAERTGNPEHVIAIRGLIERLESVQRLEESLLDAVEAETARICSAIQDGDRKTLRKCLVGYHRRRQRIVPELLAKLQGPQNIRGIEAV